MTFAKSNPESRDLNTSPISRYASLFVGACSLAMLRPAKRSSTLPTPTRCTFAAARRSSNVGATGSSEKSRRWLDTRLKDPGSPTNGRAMTRATLWSPTSIPRAARAPAYSSSREIRSSCAAIWKTLSAEVYTIHAPVSRCSAPYSSITAVPDAGLLASTCRPVACTKDVTISAGNPSG